MRQRSPGNFSWKHCGIFILLLVAFAPNNLAVEPSHFDQANRLYEQQKFGEAISLYRSMIKGGHNAPAIYFNLGNAHFKQGELGHALANYRQAEKLSPRDPDIQANLRFTRERVSGSISVRGNALQRLFAYIKLNELALTAAMLFWLWATLFTISRLRPALTPRLRTPSLIIGSLFALTLLSLGLSLTVQNEKIALITTKQATVHLGPFPESQPAFTATDGTELRLLATREDWLQVADRTDRSGWLPATNAIILKPMTLR